MEIGLLMTVWIICLLTIVLSYTALLYRMKKLTDKTIATAKKNANPIVALGPVGMDTYLEAVFLMTLQIEVSVYGNDKDPGIKTEIYTRTLISFIAYLGTTTMTAINEAYGEGYALRWFDARFKIYDLRGELDNILANPPYSSSSRNKEDLKKLEKVLTDIASATKKGS